MLQILRLTRFVAAVLLTNFLCSMTASAQQMSAVRIDGNSDFAITPTFDGGTFVAPSVGESELQITIDGDIDAEFVLTLGTDYVTVSPISDGSYSLAKPVVMERDGELAFSFPVIPTDMVGTSAEDSYSSAWADSNSAWFSGRFGWGWQESLGEFLAVNVLIPIVGVENLANASDTTLVTGTVIASVPIAVGIVAGGEVVLGVGTLGGAATTATGTGALTTVTTGAGTVHVSTVGTVATVEVGFIESVTLPLVRTVAQTAASQGARTAIVNTGPVVNTDLAIKLGLAAQNGTKVLGGTVRLVEGGIAPIFEIVIPLL